MCSASKPKAPAPTAPPPMAVPTVESEQVVSSRRRQRQRAAAAYGRESTILGSQGPVGGPTAQAKTLLGS